MGREAPPIVVLLMGLLLTLIGAAGLIFAYGKPAIHWVSLAVGVALVVKFILLRKNRDNA
jgi:hypothetical protein